MAPKKKSKVMEANKLNEGNRRKELGKYLKVKLLEVAAKMNLKFKAHALKSDIIEEIVKNEKKFSEF